MNVTELEQKAADLEAAGWTVERPAFDDPYEVMYRKMQRASMGEQDVHPADDPTTEQYEWGEWDTLSVAFLKKHFVLKSDLPPA
jgi:hypothetical protein|tara:strand:+ start:1253 stop:1504 length:252 start_codon:yes stop_codon:yes gene_type:complete